ncbi:tudor domain-containing protein 5 [Hirundo rustica]|uniref:tudor domain-containing protein 5 n=1 Tax=Hirundo rustica TaxID=43150 RepID=UPI001A93D38F|nr:tudor domain-containing protein 5 [Hirundo rustica]XP_039928863.1 tudor domain-containing protein 5 [Hirundo rustica]XP_039928864.1 tudor domain-containing protein 5 [Hirundo rustica]
MAPTEVSKQAQLMEVLKKEVRAMLIAAKAGLTPEQLEEQYTAMVCKPLPLGDLGFQSTLELVTQMPEVVRISSKNGILMLKAIADDSTKGIAKLVANQKAKTRKASKKTASKSNATFPTKNSKNPQSFQTLSAGTPVLPATVKAELQDLLSSSPLLLTDLDKAFLRRFGRAFQYRQYGFLSVFEVLRSMSDSIVIEQTKTGSLLVLRKYLARTTEKEEMPQGEAEEEEVPQGEAEEEEMPQGEAEEEEMPQGEAEEEEMPHSEAEEEEVPQDETQEEEMPQASASEMPPLEPTCETESFCQAAHLMDSEPVQTQAVDLGDHLKQHQGFEQLPSTPEIPPDAVQNRRLCSLPPLKRRSLVGVVVEFVVSPSQFYIHICSTEASNKLQDLMFEMRHVYSHKVASDKYIMPESAVRPGQLCCVMVSTWWYRVIIHRVINDREVEVFYADYGHLQIVQKSSLRFLKWHYLKLPAQAIPCSLAWVKPVQGTWSSAAVLLFKHLCHFKKLVGIVDEYVDGVLYLFLCDTSTKEDVYFHSVLRDTGYADVCEENVPSQEFEELNPSALYIQPIGEQRNTEVAEQKSRDAVKQQP